MGNNGSVLTLGNAQTFPIQHLQASFLFTGTFLAIYIGQMISQDRSQGTIKLILTRSVSRLEYYMGKVLAVWLLSLWLTLLMIALGYVIGLLFFGWGDSLVFFSVQSGGWEGFAVTMLTGLAFAFSYFAFGMIAIVVAMLADKVLETAVLLGILLMAGQSNPEDQATACIDVYQLERAVQNVLSNAYRYTRNLLSLSSAIEGRHLVLRVKNDGVRLAPGKAEKIFERFYTEERIEAQGHLGLGLSIARTITQSMKGTIQAQILDDMIIFEIRLEIEQGAPH